MRVVWAADCSFERLVDSASIFYATELQLIICLKWLSSVDWANCSESVWKTKSATLGSIHSWIQEIFTGEAQKILDTSMQCGDPIHGEKTRPFLELIRAQGILRYVDAVGTACWQSKICDCVTLPQQGCKQQFYWNCICTLLYILVLYLSYSLGKNIRPKFSFNILNCVHTVVNLWHELVEEVTPMSPLCNMHRWAQKLWSNAFTQTVYVTSFRNLLSRDKLVNYKSLYFLHSFLLNIILT